MQPPDRRPLIGDDRVELLRAAVAAPSIHNTQPWRFRFTSGGVEVFRDRARELPRRTPTAGMLHLTLDAAICSVRVAAAHLGRGAAVRYESNPSEPDLVAALDLSPPVPTRPGSPPVP